MPPGNDPIASSHDPTGPSLWRDEPAYHKAKVTTVCFSLLALFLSFLLFYSLVPGYFRASIPLRYDSVAVSEIVEGQHAILSTRSGVRMTRDLHFLLQDRPYEIVLAGKPLDRYSEFFGNKLDRKETVRMRFHPDHLPDSVIINPEELAINGRQITVFHSRRAVFGWGALAVLALVLTCIIVYLSALSSLRRHFSTRLDSRMSLSKFLMQE